MKHRLLIADRDPDLCEVFRKFFTAWSYEVDSFELGTCQLVRARGGSLRSAVLFHRYQGQTWIS